MKKSLFNSFVKDLEKTLSKHVNREAFEVTEKYCSPKEAEIRIDFDPDKIDWDKTDVDWEPQCEKSLDSLNKKWGGARDWFSSVLTWAFGGEN